MRIVYSLLVLLTSATVSTAAFSWRYDPVFDWTYNEGTEVGWKFHPDHGWMYKSVSTDLHNWYWIENGTWIYFLTNKFPVVWHNTSTDWAAINIHRKILNNKMYSEITSETQIKNKTFKTLDSYYSFGGQGPIHYKISFNENGTFDWFWDDYFDLGKWKIDESGFSFENSLIDFLEVTPLINEFADILFWDQKYIEE